MHLCPEISISNCAETGALEENKMSCENRIFDEMMKVAIARLEGRDPITIANNANVVYEDGAFRFHSMGILVEVTYPALKIYPQLSPWHSLAILHYLDLAEGVPLTGKPITFAQQKDGMVRGGGFDRKTESAIGKLDFCDLKARCQELGGVEKKSGADYCVELPFLPMYPVTLNYWLADEEFPASGRFLLDSSAEHYLTIEDSVMVGELILEALFSKSQSTAIKKCNISVTPESQIEP